MEPWAANGLRRRAIGALVAPLVVAVGLVVVGPSAAAAFEPSPGVAVVDGSPGEWGPADDVAALVGNDPPHLERGRLSLRYDCEEQVLYALLRAGPGLRLEATDAAEAYLRLGSEAKLVKGTDGVDGEAPDAAWVDRRGGTAEGVEMSAPLAPGAYDDLRVHAKLPDDSADGYETLDLAPRYQDLVVACADDPVVDDVVDDAGVGPAGVVTAGDPPLDPGDPATSPGLARTGASDLSLLVAVGTLLFVAGTALRTRRWGRPARR